MVSSGAGGGSEHCNYRAQDEVLLGRRWRPRVGLEVVSSGRRWRSYYSLDTWQLEGTG